MISVDTFRPDFMGRYTGEADDSPALDQFMERGVVLEDHRGCSNWTLAAVACVQSGMRSTESGYIVRPGVLDPVPGTVQLASEVLQGAGYQTALISGNTVFGPETALDQGFDSTFNQKVEADGIVEYTLDAFGDLDPAQPWYVHAHFFDPHTPYVSPEEFLGDTSHLPPIPYDLTDRESYADIHSDWGGLSEREKENIAEHFKHHYKAEVRHMDYRIGLLLEELEAGGWLDEALVVFWSDHGEQLGEHGELGHGHSLYLDEVDAVAAFMAPGLRPAIWSGPTEHVDIWPTILDALALEVDAPFLGVGDRPDDHHRFSSHTAGSGSQQTVERGDARLYYRWSGELQLFRLGDDPGEQSDVFDPADPDAQDLWALLEPEIEALHDQMSDGEPVDPGAW